MTIFNKAKNKRTIYFDELAKALNCMDSYEPLELEEATLYKYKYKSPNDYINNLEKFISKNGLSKNITVQAEYKEESDKNSLILKYTININDLTIILEEGRISSLCLVAMPYLNREDNKDTVLSNLHSAVINFQNNIFTCSNTILLSSNKQDYSEWMTFSLMGDICISFDNNVFKRINCALDLLEGIHNFAKAYQFNRLNILQAIDGDKGNGMNMVGHLVASPRIILRHKVSKELGNMADDQLQSIKVFLEVHKITGNPNDQEQIDDKDKIYLTPEDVAFVNKSHVIINNNEIDKLSLGLPMRVTFEGKNKMECISRWVGDNIDPFYNSDAHNKNDLGFDIFWGPYNQVDKNGNHVKENIEFFLYLKDRAIANKDKSQEIIINRELTKCDAHLIKNERWRESFQDKLILLFGRVASDHGVSLIRPFFGLLCLNVLATAFVVLPFHEQLLNWTSIGYIFIETLNPISSIGSSIEEKPIEEVIKGAGKLWVSLINALQKLGFALMAYEFIRVGRRFTTK